MPSRVAAAGETSMMRPLVNGPRSVTRTTTDRPLVSSVTVTCVPNGSVGCAATSAPAPVVSPLAVGLGEAWGRYQDAVPVCMQGAGAGDAATGAGAGAGVAQAGNASSTRPMAHRGRFMATATLSSG